MNSEATFDVLYLIDQLAVRLSGLEISELHTLSYFSCVVSVFDARQTNDWGYGFITSSLGGIFAEEIQRSADWLVAAGLIARATTSATHRVVATPDGAQRLEKLQSLSRCRWRSQYHNVGVHALLRMSPGEVVGALRSEPILDGLFQLQRVTALLRDWDVALMKKELEPASLILGGDSEVRPLLLGMLWLEALSKRADRLSREDYGHG